MLAYMKVGRSDYLRIRSVLYNDNGRGHVTLRIREIILGEVVERVFIAELRRSNIQVYLWDPVISVDSHG
jgi:hypothetical protein